MSLKFPQKSAPEVDNYGITDSTTFFNQIPLEVKASIPLLNLKEFELSTIDACIHKIINQINDNLTITDTNFIEFQKLLDIQNADKFNILFNGLYCIITTIIKNKINLNVAKLDLLNIQIHPEIVDMILTIISNNRLPLEISTRSNNKASFPKLSSFRWRIDVTLSTSHLAKLMKPSILMQLTLNNGIIQTFEVSVDQFNQLRYGVAKLLSEMKKLERHPIMKIVGEFEHRDEIERMKFK